MSENKKFKNIANKQTFHGLSSFALFLPLKEQNLSSNSHLNIYFLHNHINISTIDTTMSGINICDMRHAEVMYVAAAVHYASGDVNNNSINSAHRHQPKGTTVPVEAVLLRKNTAFPGCSRSVMGASTNTDAHGQIRTTQSVIFEGSRLSQRGRASASIHACTCTSQQELDQCVPHDVASRLFYSLDTHAM